MYDKVEAQMISLDKRSFICACLPNVAAESRRKDRAASSSKRCHSSPQQHHRRPLPVSKAYPELRRPSLLFSGKGLQIENTVTPITQQKG